MWYFSQSLAVFRLLQYSLWTVIMVPLIMGLNRGTMRLSEQVIQFYWRGVCRLFGIQITMIGMPARRPCLFVANHTSYIDIAVLGAILPASFVAKQEIATWPVFGFLARLQRTVFIERRARHAKTQSNMLGARLGAMDNLILFPEGTSSDGTRVLEFKSTLFSIAVPETVPDAVREKITVQPISVAYTHLDGIPLDRYMRPFFAWYGDMSLMPHLYRMAGIGRIHVSLSFHSPVSPTDVVSRKALSDYCQKQVAAGIRGSAGGEGFGLAASSASR